jgi:hypothetical protein
MAKNPELPISWAPLLEQAREAANYSINGPLAHFASRVRAKPDPVHAPATLGSASEALARAAVALGPGPLSAATADLNEAFQYVMGSFAQSPGKPNVVPPLLLLQYDSTVRCCGHPPAIASREGVWIPALVEHAKRLDEVQRRTLAFFALASDQTVLLPALLGGTIPPFQPGQTFQFNVDGFLRHLAAGLEVNAAGDAIEPAWASFLQAFPRLLGSDVLKWAGLLAAARAVYTRFHGVEIGVVAQRLHDRVIGLP